MGIPRLVIFGEETVTHGVLRCTPHVRFGSLAAATVLTVGVRFTPESVHERGRTARPLWAAATGLECGPCRHSSSTKSGNQLRPPAEESAAIRPRALRESMSTRAPAPTFLHKYERPSVIELAGRADFQNK